MAPTEPEAHEILRIGTCAVVLRLEGTVLAWATLPAGIVVPSGDEGVAAVLTGVLP